MPPTPTRGLLSVADSTALASAGFEPVCEVIGAISTWTVPGGFYSPGTTWSGPNAPRQVGYTFTSSDNSRVVGTPQTIVSLRQGYRTMMDRLTEQARAVGADGVVGIKVQLPEPAGRGWQQWSFLAVGTAVRSTGRTRAGSPFSTDLSGAQVAAAARAGYVPVSLLIVPCMAIRTIDQRSSRRLRNPRLNAEIDAYTDLVNTLRQQVRSDFSHAALQLGADAAVLSELSIKAEAPIGECSASALIRGTALASFEPPARSATPLTIMPLHGRASPALRTEKGPSR